MADSRWDGPSTVTYNFGQQNEHCEAEIAALDELERRHGRNLNVLVVASCGTHAITMCGHRAVKRVVASDTSLAQIRLCELVRVASITLDSEGLARFLGYLPEARVGERVDEVFVPLLAPLLPEATRDYWMQSTAWIQHGLIHSGGDARVYGEIRSVLTAAYPGPIFEDELAKHSPEKFHQELLQGFPLKMLLQCMPEFGEELLTRLHGPMTAAWARMSVAASALRRPDFLREYVFRGTIPRELFPLLLQPEKLAAVHAAGAGPDRLSFVHASIEVAGAAHGMGQVCLARCDFCT